MTTRDVYARSTRGDWNPYGDPDSPYGSFGWLYEREDQWQVPVDDVSEEEPLVKDSNLLPHRFEVDDQAQLEVYLDKHQGLSLILIEAADQLNARFPRSELSLGVVSFREAENYQQLFIYVKTDLPIKEASDKLDTFDIEWFLEADTRSNHAFNVKLRYM